MAASGGRGRRVHWALTTERACNRYASVRARDVSFCKIGGELFGDCLDYLPLEIPIDPPR